MRKKLGIFAVCTAVILTGCSTSVPDLSNVDNDIVAQYMADTVLQHDKNYEDAFQYDHSILLPTPEPTKAPQTPQATEQPGGGTGSDSVVAGGSSASGGASVNGGGSSTQEAKRNIALSDLYGISGIGITGSSYSVKNSYGSDYYAYTAKKGKKLLVANFTISNNKGGVETVNLADQDIDASLIVNGKTVAKPSMTMVEGDLQYFKKSIAGNQKKQGVLIFEIDKSLKVSGVQVQFTKGNSQSVVTMQ